MVFSFISWSLIFFNIQLQFPFNWNTFSIW